MSTTHKFETIPVAAVVISPDRQRKNIDRADLEALKSSISAIGLINPITVTRELVLVAGERRLTAFKELGFASIPCHFFDEVTPEESKIAELEENVRRSNLTWQEEVDAVRQIHSMYCSINPDWTQEKTASVMGVAASVVSKRLAVAEVLEEKPHLAKMGKISTVLNSIQRTEQRAAQADLDKLLDFTIPDDKPKTDTPAIIQGDFNEWSKNYSGPKFNFLHCDFPYGIDFQESEQGGMLGFSRYEDGEEVYWTLLQSLAENWDNFMSGSAHVIFWFSPKFYIPTWNFFQKHLPQVQLSPYPLIWHKSDNKGIVPDAQRGPRQVYEMAFFGRIGDKPVVKAVANVHSSPTSKDIHVSEKPMPMLRHFFSMLVDDTTRILDPTCGSGNALRVATEFRADGVLGLELSKEIADNAERAFKQHKRMLEATK